MGSTTTVKNKKPLIIDPERQAHENVSELKHFTVKVDFKELRQASFTNSFLMVPMAALTKHAPPMLEVFKALRVIFVVEEDRKGVQNVDAFLDKIIQSNLEKLLPKLFVTDKFEEINRVLHAWCDGVQSSTIAEAWADNDMLVFKTCALERLEIAFAQLPWLNVIPTQDRDSFEIEPFGRYLVWHKHDVHLSLDAVRCATDADFRKKRDIALVTKNKEFGKAIAKFREQNGLSQQDIYRSVDITDRQLRRIEREGHSLSVQMVDRLAMAHGITANEYLNAIAKLART